MQRVLRIEADALRLMADTVGEAHRAAVELLAQARGRIVVAGVGKSGHVGHKMAATFASTGTPAQFVHPTEASHGDLGMITKGDVCVVISNSGETRELVDLITYTRRFGIPMLGITGQPGSTVDQEADVTLLLPNAPEACAIGRAPTTSTTATLALGDALAVALMYRRGFRPEDFQVFHPGGTLGAALKRVESLMHPAAAVPQVAPEAPMRAAIEAMTQSGFGIVGVVSGGVLVGVITDGDLRRNLDRLAEASAGDIASGSPRTVPPGTAASEALRQMDEARISALFVTNDAGRVLGLLRTLDCLRAGVA